MPDVFDYTVSAGLPEAPPARADLRSRSRHARRRRHPPAGHAVRLEPHELLAGSSAVVMYCAARSKRLQLRLAAQPHVSGRNVGQSTTLTRRPSLHLPLLARGPTMRAVRSACRARAAAPLVAAAVFAAGCSTSIPDAEELPPASAASTDANAGNWRMIVAERPRPVHRAAARRRRRPTRTRRSWLDQDRPGQPHRHAARGNRLLERRRRAALEPDPARAGRPLQPAAGARAPNGTYPLPDANNPFADPAFPFANPPYAARAYSYVTVAAVRGAEGGLVLQVPVQPPVAAPGRQRRPGADARHRPARLSVGGRRALRRVDRDAAAAVPGGGRGDHAAGPASSARRRSCRAGPTASDIAAGLALGRAVAAVFVAARGLRRHGRRRRQRRRSGRRSRTPPTARGEIPWTSLETPPRPPMLPNFGQVRAWMMTPTDIVDRAARAAPVDLVRADAAGARGGEEHGRPPHARAAGDRATSGTTAPAPTRRPGHWNDIAAEYVRDARFSEVRAARVFALLNMAMHDAARGLLGREVRLLQPAAVPARPAIKTSIGLPNFPSYTSGHSTFSAAAAVVLSYLFPAGASSFDAMKDEAGISRLYGGIHYRADIEIGKDHGLRIGGYTVAFARQDGAD